MKKPTKIDIRDILEDYFLVTSLSHADFEYELLEEMKKTLGVDDLHQFISELVRDNEEIAKELCPCPKETYPC